MGVVYVNNENNDKTKEQLPSMDENVTIMPTMLDESDVREEKRVDLSAIIPKFDDLSNNKDAVELSSKENTLKSDGAVLLALVDGDGQARMTSNAGLPIQIDIEERKKELQKKKMGKNKKEKVRKNNKEAQKFQNGMAMASFITILLLAGVFYWIFTHKTEKDFMPINVVIEVGDSLPIRMSSYVKPGVGKEIDEAKYTLDLSQVIVEVPGQYPYTITLRTLDNNGNPKTYTKNGIISIIDSTPPDLTIRNVSIVEGTNYDASNFVESCKDSSGCNYYFADVDTTLKYKTRGVYLVHIVAIDAFDNVTTKTANLVIEAQGDVATYIRSTNFDFTAGYETTESYELHFNSNVLINGTHQIIYSYQDEEKYNEARKTYSGEANYVLDDAQKTITFKETVSTIGSNYSTLEHIDDYLRREGFSKI